MAAWLSSGSVDPSHLLAKSSRSLLAQATADPNEFQSDGWGIFWGKGKGGKGKGEKGGTERHSWTGIKSPKACFTEREKFAAVARRAKSSEGLCHIRRASNPRGLPRRVLIGERESQPFSDGDILFGHNGSVADPVRIALTAGTERLGLRGFNDSEAVFRALLFLISRQVPGASDSEKVCRAIRALPGWIASLHPHMIHGLNLVVQIPGRLWALSFQGSAEGGSSLISWRWPYWRLAWRVEKGTLWVCSEPMDDGDWRPLPDRHLLEASLFSGKIRIQTCRI